MKFYGITIKPTSGIGTPLKGDTIFGHFCWQAARDPDLLNGGLKAQVDTYENKPFIIFSSAFPKLTADLNSYALKRPDMPLSFFIASKKMEKDERIREAKKLKKMKWMIVKEDLSINISKKTCLNGKELLEKMGVTKSQETQRKTQEYEKPQFLVTVSQSHNKINRLTMTTGSKGFDPYSESIFYYSPGTELVIFVLIDETVTDIKKVQTALINIGKLGYGKDSSIGMGRFEVIDCKELSFPVVDNANACYTLSPSVPEKDAFADSYFIPFIRFGKHGDEYARLKNPFKNPVITADEGSVFLPKDRDTFKKPYIGRGLKGLSKAPTETIMQGYSIYIPFRLEN